MESAIPEHLRSARTRHRRIPDDYAPPYPSFVARQSPSVERVVMAYFGVQTRGEPSKGAAQAVGRIASSFEANGGPSHWDRARYLDEAGFINVVTVGYWDDRAKFDGWFPTAREQWTGEQRGNRRIRHVHRAALSSGGGLRNPVLFLGTRRRRRCPRRRHERRGAGTRLLGRHARSDSAVPNQ